MGHVSFVQQPFQVRPHQQVLYTCNRLSETPCKSVLVSCQLLETSVLFPQLKPMVINQKQRTEAYRRQSHESNWFYQRHILSRIFHNLTIISPTPETTRINRKVDRARDFRISPHHIPEQVLVLVSPARQTQNRDFLRSSYGYHDCVVFRTKLGHGQPLNV